MSRALRVVELFVDNHLLIVNKPAGVLAQGDGSARLNMLDACKAHIARCAGKPGAAFLGLVHRLDRPVSGVMLFARTSKAAARISAAFRDDRVQKHYVAVVKGDWHARQNIAATLLRAPKVGNTVVTDSNAAAALHGHQSAGMTATPVLRVLASSSTAAASPLPHDVTVLLVRLHTGRKHQIRALCAHVGHPIVGDTRYGYNPTGNAAAPRHDDMIALHAYRLQVPHPTLPHDVTVTCPLPQQWQRWLSQKTLADVQRACNDSLCS